MRGCATRTGPVPLGVRVRVRRQPRAATAHEMLRALAVHGGRRTTHHFVEHTGELELRLRAPDLAALMEEAARALAEIMAEDAGGSPEGAVETVCIAASDRESLLVEWLNELVYRADVKKRVYGDVQVERVVDVIERAGVARKIARLVPLGVLKG